MNREHEQARWYAVHVRMACTVAVKTHRGADAAGELAESEARLCMSYAGNVEHVLADDCHDNDAQLALLLQNAAGVITEGEDDDD